MMAGWRGSGGAGTRTRWYNTGMGFREETGKKVVLVGTYKTG